MTILLSMIFKKTIAEELFDPNKDWFRQVFSQYYLAAERGIGSTLLYFELHGVNISFSPKIEKDVLRKEFLLGEIFYAYKSIINDDKHNNRLIDNIYVDVFDEKKKYNRELLIIFSNEGFKEIKAKMENYLKIEEEKIFQTELLKIKLLDAAFVKLDNFFKEKGIDCNFLEQKGDIAEKELKLRSFKKIKTVINGLKLTKDEYKFLPGFSFVIADQKNEKQAKIIFDNNVFTVKTSVSEADLSKVLAHLLEKRRDVNNNDVKKFDNDLIEYIATTSILDIDTEKFIKLIPDDIYFIKEIMQVYHPDKWHFAPYPEKDKVNEIARELIKKLTACKNQK